MNVGAALAHAREQGLARLEAQLLLAELLQKDRGWLIANDDATLNVDVGERFVDWVRQRADAVPLAYLTGQKEFHGLLLQVNEHTLVPRPDTEVLVDWALELLPQWARPRVVDLGTGSGAIALALAAKHPAAKITAVDLSVEALTVASSNATRLGLDVEVLAGSWWQPLARRSDGPSGEVAEWHQFELIVSNPPYIAGDDPHLPALRHEPLSALTPGGDGLDSLREIVAGAGAHLCPGGWLLLEHGYDQAAAVAELLNSAGFELGECRLDLGGQPRVSGARRPSRKP